MSECLGSTSGSITTCRLAARFHIGVLKGCKEKSINHLELWSSLKIISRPSEREMTDAIAY